MPIWIERRLCRLFASWQSLFVLSDFRDGLYPWQSRICGVIVPPFIVFLFCDFSRTQLCGLLLPGVEQAVHGDIPIQVRFIDLEDYLAINLVYKSIAEIGLLNPITVTADNTLIAGRHRLEAAKLLGWTEICQISSPCPSAGL